MSREASGSPRFSFANGANIDYLEQLYVAYQRDPASVDESWRKFFEGFDLAAYGDLVGRLGRHAGAAGDGAAGSDDRIAALVEAFINAWRRLGHLSAHLDPLSPPPKIAEDMLPAAHGLGGIDTQRRLRPANLKIQSDGGKDPTFAEIYKALTETYGGRIGADFREINDIQTVQWFQEKMEGCRNQPAHAAGLKRHILTKLSQAEGFEQFIGRRYVGMKRFSLEGSDALIPLLDVVAHDSAEAGVEEIVVGMAHRGRLNTLCNFMGKSYELMLKEFEGTEYNSEGIDGDVKYHMGFASEVATYGQKRIRLYLSPNPSHLEAVNPVVEGFVRARQRLLNDSSHHRVLPVLMHGDAAFMGQGTVAETLNLSQLAAYTTGGTIHVITNNQIGFTTDPNESRATTYSSDIAKMVRAPVLHVNGDDPDAVAWCAQLAVAYRQKFQKDIIIDLVGYRRHGHNEGDDPSMTQPLMYRAIAKHPTALRLYADKLIAEGVATKEDVEREAEHVRNRMQAAYEAVHGKKSPQIPAPVIPAALQRCMSYRKVTREEAAAPVATGVPVAKLKGLLTAITTVPKSFTPHPKLVRLLDTRAKMLDGEGTVDWAMGELLSLGSLAVEGHHVRLTGQDACRGTFVTRHSVLTDYETNQRYELMQNLSKDQASVNVINSPLSEAGCLGFEFGYSVADPDSLVLWEAQFGDFVNGAQIIIDQFLSASEAKWKQCSGLVMLLPHGYEGQGPEHSSARPERFLQLCGNLNIQVVNSTTPAQHFHVLRRQLHRDFRKPLIIMTPKSLLREPLCVSRTEEFVSGRFEEVLDDTQVVGKDREKVERIIACSGKIYYDLFKARAENPDFQKVAIVRMEQLYPFPYARMEQLLASYPRLSEIIWTQEEPQNMGSWNFVRGRLLELIKPSQKLSYVGRANSGTPAEGYQKAHELEQKRIIGDALGLAAGLRKATAATGK